MLKMCKKYTQFKMYNNIYGIFQLCSVVSHHVIQSETKQHIEHGSMFEFWPGASFHKPCTETAGLTERSVSQLFRVWWTASAVTSAAFPKYSQCRVACPTSPSSLAMHMPRLRTTTLKLTKWTSTGTLNWYKLKNTPRNCEKCKSCNVVTAVKHFIQATV